MALNLPQGIHEYFGRNTDRMPKMLKVGEVPMSAARFMQARLKDGKEFQDLWNYADTSDLAVYPRGNDKDIYVLLTVDNQMRVAPNGKKALELIRQDNLASNHGAIVEKLGDIKGANLIKIPRKKVIAEKGLIQRQILKELVWRVLARHPDEVPAGFAEDKNLLNDYSREVQSGTGCSENMAIYLGNSLDDRTTLKAWCVSGLEGRSDAVGWGDLDCDFGRLLGELAPEAPSMSSKGVERIAVPARKVLSVAQVLEEACQTSAFAPDQIKKLQNTLNQGGYEIRKAE